MLEHRFFNKLLNVQTIHKSLSAQVSKSNIPRSMANSCVVGLPDISNNVGPVKSFLSTLRRSLR